MPRSSSGALRLFHECFNSLPGCHVLADSEVFLMYSQSADSLDGRYFRVLPTATIIGKAASLDWLGGMTLQHRSKRFVHAVWPTKIQGPASHDDRNHSDPPIR